MKNYCENLNKYTRRKAHEVRFGSVVVGGDQPIAVQSMANCSTMDTDACVAQTVAVRNAGGHVMRFTAPGKREGENLKQITEALRAGGCADVATVADIHFTPDVAMIAARYVDKVRINPGNYKNDAGQLHDLIAQCRERGVALRIGVNHGSLAPHIMEQYGDTPEGMVASAMEFLRECRKENFDAVVVSIKSSNVRVMVHAYRLLAATMAAEGMTFPLHLGVTEAGDALAARVKSAVGIGTLLADGIGDTIRVSLTEPPQNEIPVGQLLVDYFADRASAEVSGEIAHTEGYSPYEFRRRATDCVEGIGGESVPVLYEELTSEQSDAVEQGRVVMLSAESGNCVAEWRSAILNMSARGDRRPVILSREYCEDDLYTLAIKVSADFGALFIDGLADGVRIINNSDKVSVAEIRELGLALLQASRVRISTTEYIACPGCGRTLYDLQSTLARIKARTSHLKGLKIGVMGCIVNGPGEMADADYGYVGSGKGLVTLYRGREVVRRSVPQDEAIDALIDLIRECGDWKEAE